MIRKLFHTLGSTEHTREIFREYDYYLIEFHKVH